MKNGCNWLGPSGICDQLKFYPNQIKFLSLPVENNSDKLKNLINTRKNCGSLPDKFHTDFNDICNAATKLYKENFQNSTTCLQTNIYSNTSLRNRHLINPLVVDWYDHIFKRNYGTTKSFGLVECG